MNGVKRHTRNGIWICHTVAVILRRPRTELLIDDL